MTILIDSNIGPISNSLLLYTLIVYAFAFVYVYLKATFLTFILTITQNMRVQEQHFVAE